MSVDPRYSVEGPDSTPKFALNLLLVLGSVWFMTVLLAIVFVLGIQFR